MAKKKATTKKEAAKKATGKKAVKKTAAKKTDTGKKVAATTALTDEQENSVAALLEKKTPKGIQHAIDILRSLKRYADAPSDEIFGDDPQWFFDGLFGTSAPVHLAEDCYEEQDGLLLLRVNCRNARYTLIADSEYEFGYIRNTLVILSIVNTELERTGNPDRAYSIGHDSCPGLLLLTPKLSAATKALAHKTNKIFSLENLRTQYESLSKSRHDIPWIEWQ